MTDSPTASPTAESPQLRRQRGFLRFWTASTISDFGTPITTLALQVLAVLTLDATATELGLLSAARWVPYLALGLLVGVLLDRARRRLPVLVVCDIVRAGLLGLIPLLHAVGRLDLVSLAAVMAAFGVASVVNDAASQSVLPRLVDRRVLTAANARLEQSGAVAQTTGPLLAGVLVRVVGAPVAFLIDAVSYLGLPSCSPRSASTSRHRSARTSHLVLDPSCARASDGSTGIGSSGRWPPGVTSGSSSTPC